MPHILIQALQSSVGPQNKVKKMIPSNHLCCLKNYKRKNTPNRQSRGKLGKERMRMTLKSNGSEFFRVLQRSILACEDRKEPTPLTFGWNYSWFTDLMQPNCAHLRQQWLSEPLL